MFEAKPAQPSSRQDCLTVSELNRRAKQLLETHLPLIWVEGEISNKARPSSGHWYFTLKDERAQVRCAMFRGRNQQVRFEPRQGQQVLLRARVSLYENRGDYQLIVEHMEEAGFGALQRAFEALKQRLATEGLFDQTRKRPIPELPRHIGVISSSSGAALRDVLHVLQRRFPSAPVTLIPVPVQGREAAPAIIAALALAERAQLFDVLILTRGGGSLEDLWCFNDEALARAMAACELPIVTGVGHEVDVTIADFVADLRAPTPSAAAELVVPDVQDWLARFRTQEQRLRLAMNRQLQAHKTHLEQLRKRLRHPGERLQQQSQRLDGLEMRLKRAMETQLRHKRQRLNQLILRQRSQRPEPLLRQKAAELDKLKRELGRQVRWQLEAKRRRLNEASRMLDSVSPLRVLDRGFALVTNDQGQLVKTSKQVQPGDRLNTRLAEGEIVSCVERCK